MTENKRFIIDVEETHQENAVWEYDDEVDDYDFVCYEDDSDSLVGKLNKLADKLNKLEKENEQLKDALNQRTDQCDKYYKENEQLKQQLESEHQMLDNAILLERTRMGKNCLKQFKQQLGGNND